MALYILQDLWEMDPAVTSRGVVPHFDKYLDPLMENAKNATGAPVPANFQTRSSLTRAGSLTLKTEEEMKKSNSFSVLMPMIKVIYIRLADKNHRDGSTAYEGFCQ